MYRALDCTGVNVIVHPLYLPLKKNGARPKNRSYKPVSCVCWVQTCRGNRCFWRWTGKLKPQRNCCWVRVCLCSLLKACSVGTLVIRTFGPKFGWLGILCANYLWRAFIYIFTHSFAFMQIFFHKLTVGDAESQAVTLFLNIIPQTLDLSLSHTDQSNTRQTDTSWLVWFLLPWPDRLGHVSWFTVIDYNLNHCLLSASDRAEHDHSNRNERIHSHSDCFSWCFEGKVHINKSAILNK